MKKASIISLLFIVGCVGLHQPPLPSPSAQGCQFYCFPKDSVTNTLLSLIASNKVTGHVTTYMPGGVLALEATNDIVTATFSQIICSNQPQDAITFAWFCSNRLYSLTKQLPSNSYDVDYGPLANCADCSWSVSYIQASQCENQRPIGVRQFVNEDGKQLIVKRR